MCGFVVQQVEHRTRIPLKPWFFQASSSNCLSWKIYGDDHSSLSSTTAVQIWIISYILHIIEIGCQPTDGNMIVIYFLLFHVRAKSLHKEAFKYKHFT